jgi:hypothetical protein
VEDYGAGPPLSGDPVVERKDGGGKSVRLGKHGDTVNLQMN